MIAQGTLYLGKTRPSGVRAANGEFVLSLFAIHAIGYLKKEPYQIIYSGEQAAQFWQQHQHELTPGQPLEVTLRELRAHAGGRVGAQIQAKCMALRLLPRAGAPVPAGATQSPATVGHTQ